MIELPEALTLARELNDAVVGKTVRRVFPPTKPHKFCWFNGDPAEYGEKLKNRTVRAAEGTGIYVELTFTEGLRLCVNDGVNMRFVSFADAPKDYQLLIAFTDGTALAFTVAMYGGIVLHHGDYDNEYYFKSRNAVSPFSEEFTEHYHNLLAGSKPNLSAKAFLATGQHFPGLGNGVLQDILFAAGIHPKRKLGILSGEDTERLLRCIVSVLREMTDGGGRNTEKDIYGKPGCYTTKMSNISLPSGCPACGGEIKKEAYLGGSVYYCPKCQPLDQA